MNRSGKGKKVAFFLSAAVMAVLGVSSWQCWQHILFFWRFEALEENEQGYLQYRHRRTGIIFVRLPGGRCYLGTQDLHPRGQNHDPDSQINERPLHRVVLSPFLLARHEVTQAQWISVMGYNPSARKGSDLPVEGVSWQDCREFCEKVGLQLPTEARWEYACRAGTTTPYGGTGNLAQMGWYGGNCTFPVGRLRPNHFGLYDMHGNVWEWCEDVYDGSFYSKPEAGKPDPVATSGSICRVIRGGGLNIYCKCCRSGYRDGFLPSYRGEELGFRVAAALP